MCLFCRGDCGAKHARARSFSGLFYRWVCEARNRVVSRVGLLALFRLFCLYGINICCRLGIQPCDSVCLCCLLAFDVSPSVLPFRLFCYYSIPVLVRSVLDSFPVFLCVLFSLPARVRMAAACGVGGLRRILGLCCQRLSAFGGVRYDLFFLPRVVAGVLDARATRMPIDPFSLCGKGDQPV